MAGAIILLVDDDPLVAGITAAMLDDLGHAVIETHSGAEALAVLRTDRPVDLMITDVSMPAMTGPQLALAARPVRPGLPVLLISGYANLTPAQTQALPCLVKPYDQSMLAAEIAKLWPPAAGD